MGSPNDPRSGDRNIHRNRAPGPVSCSEVGNRQRLLGNSLSRDQPIRQSFPSQFELTASQCSIQRPLNMLAQRLVKGTYVRGHLLVITLEKETGNVFCAEVSMRKEINVALARYAVYPSGIPFRINT